MCEALEIGRDLVPFPKKKKAGVSSVVSKESGGMRCLRGRQELDHARPGCYAKDFVVYLNAKVTERADLYF